MAAWISSGATAISTSSAAAVDVLTNANKVLVRELHIFNAGAVDGLFSIDGGTTWAYLPSTPSGYPVREVVLFFQSGNPVVLKIKRPSSSDVANVWAWAI